MIEQTHHGAFSLFRRVFSSNESIIINMMGYETSIYESHESSQMPKENCGRPHDEHDVMNPWDGCRRTMQNDRLENRSSSQNDDACTIYSVTTNTMEGTMRMPSQKSYVSKLCLRKSQNLIRSVNNSLSVLNILRTGMDSIP